MFLQKSNAVKSLYFLENERENLYLTENTFTYGPKVFKNKPVKHEYE